MEKPELWIEEFAASDGTHIKPARGDVVVIVGPNNSGKTAALVGLRDKVENPEKESPVVESVEIGMSGTDDLLMGWLQRTARRTDNPPDNPNYAARGAAVHEKQARQYWQGDRPGLGSLTRFFCHLLTAEERLATANPANAIALTQEPLSHPIHYLQRHDKLERALSDQFRRAFDEDLIVHRNAGSQVPLYVGPRPVPGEDEDRVSHSYVERLEELPELSDQGDGMRSFAGVLLHSFTGEETILLIDEPEAFLHPPQARLLGRVLVTDKPASRQLFLATHSADVLRGVLDASSDQVRVIRVRREGNVNPVTELDSKRISQLWSDPLLRYSNVFDGLFHEGVIVCESDSDCRFYEAIMDAITEDEEGDRPDLLFTHCGGKHRVPMVARALSEMGVPVLAIVDFDVLNDDRPLKDIVEALGGDWVRYKSDRKTVDSAIRSKEPEKEAAEVDAEIRAVLDDIEGPDFPKDATKAIRRILRRSSAWSTAKETGAAYVPAGDPTKAWKRLSERLAELGVHVVQVGQLESFDKSVGNHGPTWVNRVLKKDLKKDEELEAARQFVRSILNAF